MDEVGSESIERYEDSGRSERRRAVREGRKTELWAFLVRHPVRAVGKKEEQACDEQGNADVSSSPLPLETNE